MKIVQGKKIVEGKAKWRSYGGTIIELKGGKRVWKGDSNNYVEDTPKEKRRKKEEAYKAEHKQPEFEAADFEMPKVSLFELLLGLAAGSAFMTAMLCIGIVAGFFYALIAAWPHFLSLLVGAFAKGAISVPLIVFTAAVIFLICYLIRCIRKVRATKQALSKRYALICMACIAIPYILLDLLSIGISLPAILGRIFDSAAFALLPTVILGCVEYKANGGKHLVRSIAQTICKGNGLLRVIFVGLGIAALGMSAVFLFFLLPAVGVMTGIGAIAAFFLTGIFFIAMGVCKEA